MERHVELKNGSFDIVIEGGCWARAGVLLDLDRKVLIVTDKGVPRDYVDAVEQACTTPVVATLYGTEQSKTMATVEALLEKMAAESFTEKDCVVAVGGGIVGDIAGFVASCYMCGVDFYNIPTTYVAQFDASISGRTGVNLADVSNLVGAVYMPKKVLVDPEVLRTLDRREASKGMYEFIKLNVASADEFETMLANGGLTEEFCDLAIEASLKKLAKKQ